MNPKPNIIDFVTDPELLGLNISFAQETLLRSIYGLPLSDEQLQVWRHCTGRTVYPGRPFKEVTVIAGARAGKDSRIAAPIVLYECCFGGHEHILGKGEKGTVVLVAQDANATKIAFGYIREYLTKSPLLRSMLEGEPLASEIVLTNGLSIKCFPSTLRSMRGYSIPTAIMDEVAFYRLEGSADSDTEIEASVSRGMLRFTGSKLVKISTPYMKSGILYRDFTRAFGEDDADLLVWRASSLLMNPTLASSLEAERRRLAADPQRFARDYEAEFTDDVDAFLPAQLVEMAVMRGRRELPPRDTVRYTAAVDPSGGGADAFTLSIVHIEGQGSGRRVVQDVMKGWSRLGSQSQLDLGATVQEIAGYLKRYNIHTIHGDRYASGWVVEAFRREGIRYETPEIKIPGDPDNEKYLDKSMAYLECEPLFHQGTVMLLDHPQLVRELTLLERRPQAQGRTRVDHPIGAHDDLANSFALAAAIAARHSARPWAGSPTLPSGVTQLGTPGGGIGMTLGGAQRGAPAGQAAYLDRLYHR